MMKEPNKTYPSIKLWWQICYYWWF